MKRIYAAASLLLFSAFVMALRPMLGIVTIEQPGWWLLTVVASGLISFIAGVVAASGKRH